MKKLPWAGWLTIASGGEIMGEGIGAGGTAGRLGVKPNVMGEICSVASAYVMPFVL